MRTELKMMGDAKTESLQKAIRELESSSFGSERGRLYRFIINETEKILIRRILFRTEGNQLRAAEILGIHRNTLYSKMKRLGIGTE